MPPYHVQESLSQTAPHHDSIEALWTMKWRKPAAMGIYPFVDGQLSDFEKVFAELIKLGLHEPYDPDAYARPFMPVAQSLVDEAASAATAHNTALASSLYLRAAALYRIARFPIARSPVSNQAWTLGKAAYLAGSAFLKPPNTQVLIPHAHASTPIELNTDIPAYLRLPASLKPSTGYPVLLFICGLDAYRTDHTNRTTEHVKRGFATLSVEIPGTGDCPADPSDATSPDRLFSSILDWIATQKGTLDSGKVVARGVSTGGYYAFRIAHTHHQRLLGVVAQGGGTHHMFDPDWIAAQDRMEYPFGLAVALAWKFGFGNDVEAYKRDAQSRFSLLTGLGRIGPLGHERESGILDRQECARLLVLNGMEDSIFPIEDSILVCRKGRVKDVRLVDGAGHMGNPAGETIQYDWIDALVKG